jgi:hypothetical protein
MITIPMWSQESGLVSQARDTAPPRPDNTSADSAIKREREREREREKRWSLNIEEWFHNTSLQISQKANKTVLKQHVYPQHISGTLLQNPELCDQREIVKEGPIWILQYKTHITKPLQNNGNNKK